MFARLFSRLAAEWATWKAGVNLEHEERMEASRQDRQLYPEVEVARVVSPDGVRDALVLRNEARRVFISVVPHGAAIGKAPPVVVFQHCLDLDCVRVMWVDAERLSIENQCNEFSVIAPAEIASRDERNLTILV